jgi:hypothetical protein
MIQLLLLLGLQGFYIVLVGGGTAGFITGDKAWTFERFFWAGLSALAISCISWSFALGVGGGLTTALFVSSICALAGWLVYRNVTVRNSNRVSTRKVIGRDIGVGLALLAACLFLALPALKNWTSLSTAVRIGPDSIGNAVAAAALAENITLRDIREDVIKGTDSSSLAEVLNFETHKLYTVLDMRTQIRTEFLVAGLRWGLPGFAAPLLVLVGQGQIWAVLPAIGAFSLLVAMVGAYLIGFRLTRKRYAAVAFAIATCANATLLNGWHEGGVSQMWTFPAIFGVVLAVLAQEKTYVQRTTMATASFTLALVGYSDLWIVLVAVVGLSALICLTMRVKDCFSSGYPLISGVLLSMLVCAPYAMQFAPYIFRRAADAGIGGWSMPVWMSPIELLGIVNAYKQPAPSGLQLRSDAMTHLQSAVNPVILGIAIGVFLSRRKQFAKYLSLSATLIVVIIYIKTRYIDHVSNYQYFKAAGLLIPMLWLFALLPSKQKGTRIREPFKTRNIVVVSSAFILISAMTYVVDFRHHSRFVDVIHPNELINESNQRFFANSNLIALPSLTLVAISSVVQLNLYGRDAFSKFEGTLSDAHRPLYLLVVENDCIAWSCLREVHPKNILELSSNLKAVLLATDSMAVFQLRENMDPAQNSLSLRPELMSLSSRLFTDAGGFGLDSFRPRSDPMP